MILPLARRIELMIRLGNHLSGSHTALKLAERQAYQQNNWFTPDFTALALRNIYERFLTEKQLASWIARYPGLQRPRAEEMKVGIVMAGNIPMVGFHDFLCGFVSGHKLRIKLSTKDQKLLQYVFALLRGWEPATGELVQEADLLKSCDAYIATGNNNSARYFEYYFKKHPHIIRRNRTSAALLDGTETEEELQRLAGDICLYFGLGCRNVTKILVPENYDFRPLLDALKRYDHFMDHHKYKNNYDYNLTLHLLNNTPYMSSGQMLLSENAAVFSPISVLHYETVPRPEKLAEALRNNPDIQCITGHGHLPFGLAQQPSLTDYADGTDTMEFLTSL